ncbi:GrdX family protein [Clostridium sp. 'deep sea']|uniref:GrdX family protein n=1 Tax=Clostridium sp. 'deep sea' TaxID=2779445 RepID=UPI0018965F92|nr:GrdX family protein [Clostridium sp. 'deep sea']QOR34315.1 GrdX family protein [Clostridium sp. 'deep sea']
MYGEFFILSNNPAIIANYNKVEAVNGDLLAVLNTARDYIHLGHKLLTHPLVGSVKPNETPYKSVIVCKEITGLDHESLSVIEGSLKVAKKMLEERPLPEWNERIKQDFQVIDQSLLDSALKSLSVY